MRHAPPPRERTPPLLSAEGNTDGVTLLLYLIQTAISIYIFMMFGRFLLSWVPLRSGTLIHRVYSVLYAATEPYLRLFRPWLPVVRLGGAAIDLSPLAGLAVLILVSRIVAAL
jgi:YggT family protein